MGRLDNKNIWLMIRLKENLTDPRVYDFVKDWDFTLEEWDNFISTVRGTLHTEKAEKIVRFFVEYKDGILLPDRYNYYHPLKYQFNKEEISTLIGTLSFPGGLIFLKKRNKFNAILHNRYWSLVWNIEKGKHIMYPPKGVLPEHLSQVALYFSKQRKIDMAFLEQLLRDFCDYVGADMGYIYDQENLELLLDIYHPERKGIILKTEDVW